jgi:hypothetical protein
MMEARGWRKVLFLFRHEPEGWLEVEAAGNGRTKMHEGTERPGHDGSAGAEQETRPQQAGEGGTTRLGMEEGDNTDVPATGGPQADEAAERSR